MLGGCGDFVIHCAAKYFGWISPFIFVLLIYKVSYRDRPFIIGYITIFSLIFFATSFLLLADPGQSLLYVFCSTIFLTGWYVILSLMWFFLSFGKNIFFAAIFTVFFSYVVTDWFFLPFGLKGGIGFLAPLVPLCAFIVSIPGRKCSFPRGLLTLHTPMRHCSSSFVQDYSYKKFFSPHTVIFLPEGAVSEPFKLFFPVPIIYGTRICHNKNWYNCAVFTDGSNHQIFYKKKLLPFGEYVPWNIFPAYNSGSSYSRGSSKRLKISVGEKNIRLYLCSEFLADGFFRSILRSFKAAKKGEFICVLVDDLRLAGFSASLIRSYAHSIAILSGGSIGIIGFYKSFWCCGAGCIHDICLV